MRLRRLTLILGSMTILLFPFIGQATALQEITALNNTLLIRFEQSESCCPSLAMQPNGSMIAYSTTIYDKASESEHSTLWLYVIHNETSKQLHVTNSSSISDLSFSPEGNELLFRGDDCDPADNRRNLYILSISDGARLQCSELSNISSADWMPDGSLIASTSIFDNETRSTRWLISAYGIDGTEELVYSESYADTFMPTVRASPDGKKVAFHLDKVLRSNEIHVLDLEKGQVKKVAENGVQPRWSPDSNYLIYKQIPPRMPPGGFDEFIKSNPANILKIVDINSDEVANLAASDNGMGFYDYDTFPGGSKLVYALYEHVFTEGERKASPLGIYIAELSRPIPEFPVDSVAVTAIGLTAVTITLLARVRPRFLVK